MKEARPTTVEERVQIAKDCIANGGNYVNRPLSSRQVKKEKLRHEGLVPVSKGSQTL